ncbi:hypothetical protein ES703_112730 [subsurface metagenome]
MVDELECFLVLGHKTHHKGTTKLNAYLFAYLNHFFCLGNCHTQRLFAENVLSSFGAGSDLFGVKVGRSSNVNGIDIRLLQVTNTRCLLGAKFFCHLSIHLCIDIEYYRQLGVAGF